MAVRDFVDKLDPLTTVVVSGGARGVDSFAVQRAEERGIRTIVIKPNWKKYGRGAGFRRNKEIVMVADDVVAFWDGQSRGTEHTIKTAIEMGKHVAIFGITGELVRSITPGGPAWPTMAVSIKEKFTKPKGPAQPPAYEGRPERRERRQEMHRQRRALRREDLP